MISKIKGSVIENGENYLVVNVNGIGFKIYSTSRLLAKAIMEKEIDLHTSLVLRENLMDLYGFKTKEELNFFELLLTISGIGPKGALGVLNQATPKELMQSITQENYSILTKVSGIGKKTAERIVLELKNKIKKLEKNFSSKDREATTEVSSDYETLEALVSLGYNEQQSREAIKHIDKNVKDVGEKIKSALKILSK